MHLFNRREVLGITAVVLIAALALFAAQWYPSAPIAEQEQEQSPAGQPSDQPKIIMVDISGKDDRAAFAEAVAVASDNDGRVQNLLIVDLAQGSGREVKVGDTVSVHYIGTLRDGPEFDNSYKRGAPFSFQVGAGAVIAGWEQGIVGMREGGKRALVIPPELGYGAVSVGPLPANATLLFSIELLSIQ